ncbi:MAG: GNAT family N-acetyltransferase [Chloroflexi bacterium]|nr:GNAT family N-acetyltransferase [Chloroflexota bacterium]
MSVIVRRSYEGEKDFQIMLDLMKRECPAAHAADYPAKVDIEENLAVEKIRATVKLWFDHGRPIGWAYVDDGDNLQWELEKSYVDVVGAEMVAWGEDCIRAAGESSTLDASCREDYKERVDFLKRHGFRQTENFSIHMKRDLSQPIPEPELPPGYLIRPVKGIEEAAAIAATHRAAFETDYMTAENRLIIMNSSEYDPTLDLLVVAPDGTIAGYCTCSTAPDGGGFTDPVAVHPDHQRKGLSKALLLKGLQALKERGMTFARFTTSGDNISMQKAGESAGFVVESRNLWFEKEVKN